MADGGDDLVLPEGWSLPKPAEELRKDYERDGFVTIPNLLSEAECDELLEEMICICRGERGEIPGTAMSETKDMSDEEVLKKYLAIHFPHKLASERVARLVGEPKTVCALRACMGTRDIKLLQTMMFMKGPGQPGQAPHQDEAYIPTRDRSLTATWIALEDVDEENGGLWVIPGSHRSGVVWPLLPTADPRYDGGTESHGHGYGEDAWQKVELKKGAAIVFNGYLLHRSLDNRTGHGHSLPRFRRSFANHYCSAATAVPWSNDKRFDVPGEGDLRDFTIVSGKDPLHGIVPTRNLLTPFIRDKDHKKRLREMTKPTDTE